MPLQNIFKKQRELMEKYSKIEMGVTSHDVPVVLNSREGQTRLRQFAWFFTEEIAEAIAAEGTPTFHEELIDALHFLVELSILSDLTPKDVTPNQGVLPLSNSFNTHVTQVIGSIGYAINALKAKPWKQSWKETDSQDYKLRVIHAFHSFLEMLEFCGLPIENLEEHYSMKNSTNHQRIASGY